MEKLDKVIAGLESHRWRCDCTDCPYNNLRKTIECTEALYADALELLKTLSDDLTGAHDEVHKLARQYQALEKKYASAIEMAAIAEEQVAAEKRAVKVARAQRDAAWEKLARVTGEREKAWLEEGLGLRTCYCPLCDKHFEVRSNDSSGNCPDCGHHVVLREVEVSE